jgi:hypothetical protein
MALTEKHYDPSLTFKDLAPQESCKTGLLHYEPDKRREGFALFRRSMS